MRTKRDTGRTIAAVTSGLGLVAAGIAVASPVQAAGEQCQGQAATIVATANNQVLTGTENADVIHTGGFTGVKVDGKEGDDIICAVAGTKADIDGGAGTTSSRTWPGRPRAAPPSCSPGRARTPSSAWPAPSSTFERATAGVTVDLAAGTVVDGTDNETVTGIRVVRGSAFPDTFTGTSGADTYVSSVGPKYDTDGDTISMGAGPDTVRAFRGTVDAGAGKDKVTAYAAVVEGGTGADTIDLRYGGTANGGPGADILKAASSVKEGPVPRSHRAQRWTRQRHPLAGLRERCGQPVRPRHRRRRRRERHPQPRRSPVLHRRPAVR